VPARQVPVWVARDSDYPSRVAGVDDPEARAKSHVVRFRTGLGREGCVRKGRSTLFLVMSGSA
jgi:hypothetical protein